MRAVDALSQHDLTEGASPRPGSAGPLAGFDAAARQVAADLALAEPVLVRVGSAMLYRCDAWALRVTGPDVPGQQPRTQQRLEQWLNQHGVPTLQACKVVGAAGGYTVATYAWIDAVGSAGEEEVGTVTGLLHTAPVPSWAPRFDPLRSTRPRLRTLGSLPLREAERALLFAAADRAEATVSAMGAQTASPSAGVLVHGDLTAHNLLRGSAGVWLHDLETAGVGHPWWDLARVHHATRRFAVEAGDWSGYVRGYLNLGGTVPTAADLVALEQVTDLIGAVWAVVNASLSPQRFAEQARVRVASWAPGRHDERTWLPL